MSQKSLRKLTQLSFLLVSKVANVLTNITTCYHYALFEFNGLLMVANWNHRFIPQWTFLCSLMMTIEMKSFLQNNTFVQVSRARVTIC